MVWYMGLQQRVAPHTIRLYPRIRGVLVDIDNDARLGPCQVSVPRLLAVAGAALPRPCIPDAPLASSRCLI